MNLKKSFTILTLLALSWVGSYATDIYFINSYSASDVYAYAWTDGNNDAAWPGTKISGGAYTVATTADGYAVYKYTTTKSNIKFDYGQGQAETNTLTCTNNYAYVPGLRGNSNELKSGLYADFTDVDFSKFSHILIVGTIGGSDWSEQKGFPLLDSGDNNTFTTKIPITKSSGNVQFLLRNWENLWGNKGTITSNVNWTWVKDGNDGYGNCTLTPSTTISGLYTITYDRYNNKIAVTYPTEVPSMTSVTAVSTTYTTATLLPVSSLGVKYQVTTSPATTTQTLTPDGDGNITVTGLTEGTKYTFTVKAIDEYGNISSGSKTVTTTTQAKYCAGTSDVVSCNTAYPSEDISTAYNYRFDTQGNKLKLTVTWNNGGTISADSWAYIGLFDTGHQKQFSISGKTLTATFDETFTAGDEIVVTFMVKTNSGNTVYRSRALEYTFGNDCGATDDLFNQNLALCKPSEAGSEAGAGEAAAQGNDGSIGTKWVIWKDNQNLKDNWWYVDLGAIYVLDHINVIWGEPVPTGYKLQVRSIEPTTDDKSDDTAWYTVATKSTPAQNTTDKHSVTQQARYVRFKATATGNFRLGEIEVYGSAIGTLDNEKPKVTAKVESTTATTALLTLKATDNQAEKITQFTLTNTATGAKQTVTVNASDQVTLTLPTNTKYNFNVTARDIAGNVSDPASVEFTLWDTNKCLAEGKTAKAENNNATAYLAVDGATNTGEWQAGANKYSWWYVDLGRFYDINNIKISWEYSHSTHFIVQTSQNAPDAAKEGDDTQWYTILDKEHTLENSDAALLNHDYSTDVEANSARYVRFRSLKDFNTDWGGAKLKEFCVFGTGFAEEYGAIKAFKTITESDISYTDGAAVITVSATDSKNEAIDHFRVVNTTDNTKAVYVATKVGDTYQLTITGLVTCTPKTVQIQAMDRGAQLSDAQTLTLEVPNGTDNLVRLKGVKVTSGTNNTAELANIYDGDYNTRWEVAAGTVAGTNEWVNIELDRFYDLRQLKIYWENHAGGGTRPLDYELQVSLDGTDYVPFVHNTTKPDALTNLDIAEDNPLGLGPVPVKHLRIWVNKHDQYSGMCLREVEAQGYCYGNYTKPVILTANVVEADHGDGDLKVYRNSAYLYATAICAGVASSTLTYHVELSDGTTRTISTEDINNGEFRIDGLAQSTTYTVKIYAVNGEDIAANRSDNYKQLTFTTEGENANFALVYSYMNWFNWVGYRDSGEELNAEYNNWLFKTTSIEGLYRLQKSITTEMVTNDADKKMWTVNLHKASTKQQTTNQQDREWYPKPFPYDLVVTAKDINTFISNLQTLYIAGSAVGTANNAQTNQLEWINATHAQWTGRVTTNGTFYLIVKDKLTNQNVYPTFDFLTPNGDTYTEDWKFATITFDLETWTWTWTEAPFVIYHHGQQAGDSHAPNYAVESFPEGGYISSPIEYRRKFSKDLWETLYLPFEVTAVQVYDPEEKEYYDITPYYRVGDTYYSEYYIIRHPDPILGLPIENFVEHWLDPTTPTYLPQKNTPYIVQFHNSYFADKYISFFGAAGQTIDDEFEEGSRSADNEKVNVYGNNTFTTGSVKSVYRLNYETYGGRAWTRYDEKQTIYPFECYILANSVTTARYKVLRRDDNNDDNVTTALNEQTTGGTTVRVWSITGQLLTEFQHTTLQQASELLREQTAEGVYILQTDSETVKVVLGGR